MAEGQLINKIEQRGEMIEINREQLFRAIRRILLDYYNEYCSRKLDTFSMGFISLVMNEYCQESGQMIDLNKMENYNKLLFEIRDIIKENINKQEAGEKTELLADISADYLGIVKRGINSGKKISIKSTAERLTHRVTKQQRQKESFDKFRRYKESRPDIYE